MKTPQHEKPLIYIAGPLTNGDQMMNVRAAIKAGQIATSLGCAVIVPHLLVLAHIVSPMNYEYWMAQDLAIIERCDALYRMEGESKGAEREVEHALSRGIQVFRDWTQVRLFCLEWTRRLDKASARKRRK